jgi:hypothetical protein
LRGWSWFWEQMIPSPAPWSNSAKPQHNRNSDLEAVKVTTETMEVCFRSLAPGIPPGRSKAGWNLQSRRYGQARPEYGHSLVLSSPK